MLRRIKQNAPQTVEVTMTSKCSEIIVLLQVLWKEGRCRQLGSSPFPDVMSGCLSSVRCHMEGNWVVFGGFVVLHLQDVTCLKAQIVQEGTTGNNIWCKGWTDLQAVRKHEDLQRLAPARVPRTLDDPQ